MRCGWLFLPIVVFLLVPAGAVLATPEEEIARLEERVKALEAQAELLKQEVADLRAKLEQVLATQPPAPPPLPPPPPPPTTGVAGAWVIDQDALADALTKYYLEQAEPILKVATSDAERESYRRLARQGALNEAKDITGKMTLEEDGTFESIWASPMLRVTLEGTWKLEGEKVTLVPTKENGADPMTTGPRTATFRDGVLTLDPVPLSPMPVVMKRP